MLGLHVEDHGIALGKREGLIAVLKCERKRIGVGDGKGEREPRRWRTKGPNHHSNRFMNVYLCVCFLCISDWKQETEEEKRGGKGEEG